LEEQRYAGPQAALKLRDFDATDVNLQTITEVSRFVPISFSIDTNSGKKHVKLASEQLRRLFKRRFIVNF
jgi:hypothetical protein